MRTKFSKLESIIFLALIIFIFISAIVNIIIRSQIEKDIEDFNPNTILEITNYDDFELHDIDNQLKEIIKTIVDESISSNDMHIKGEVHPSYRMLLIDKTILRLKLDHSRNRIYIDFYDKRGNPRIHRVLYDCSHTIEALEDSLNDNLKTS